jgi:thioredoxin 1
MNAVPTKYHVLLLLILTTTLPVFPKMPGYQKIIEIQSTRDFTSLVTNNPYVVVEFFSPGCHYCQEAKPIFESVARQKEFSRVVFARVNVDMMEQLAATHRVDSLPTFLYYSNGSKISSAIGLKDQYTFANKLREHFPDSPTAFSPKIVSNKHKRKCKRTSTRQT